MTTQSTNVSVIIPVYNDRERLQHCLSALAAQTYQHEQFEVVVVDNGSSEPLFPLETDGLHVRFESESRVGSYSARNRGLEVSKNDIIAFTDADCIPAADWIEKGVHYLTCNPEVGLLAGRVRITVRDPDQPSMVELHEVYYGYQQEEHISREKFGATANIFTRREVIESVGSFNDRLKSGGDVDWGQRVAALGYRLLYAGDVVVDHPARQTFRQIAIKKRRIIGGRFDRQRDQPFARVILIVRLAWNVVRLLVAPVQALFDSRVPRLDYRLRLARVEFLLQLVTIHERARLVFGAASERR